MGALQDWADNKERKQKPRLFYTSLKRDLTVHFHVTHFMNAQGSHSGCDEILQ